MHEDPERHIGELVDCLMQSSRPLAFFLGAGCPCAVRSPAGDPLIPDIDGLTTLVIDALGNGPHAQTWQSLRATCEQDGHANPNIEHILDRIRGLASYAGVGEVRGLSRGNLETLERAVCTHIVHAARVELPDSDNPYRALAVWISATRRSEPIELFTTNYDLLLEQALERQQVAFFDGFVGARRPFFDVESIERDGLPVRWSRLWKIHGSVNWQRDSTRREIYRSEEGDSVVIHPSNLKYDESRKLPYLALIDRLRRFLRSGQPVMASIGYSFRDQHLNEAIAESLGSNPTAMLFGLMHGAINSYPEAQTLARRCPNLRLYAADACVIGTRLIPWSHQKAQPEEKFPKGVIEWTQTESPEAPWHPKVMLGDFARLGDLLYYVSQGRRPKELVPAVSA